MDRPRARLIDRGTKLALQMEVLNVGPVRLADEVNRLAGMRRVSHQRIAQMRSGKSTGCYADLAELIGEALGIDPSFLFTMPAVPHRVAQTAPRRAVPA